MPIEQIVQHFLGDLFPGMQVLEAEPFQITRNADLERNEEEAEDLLDLIEEELRHRRFAPTVRLEVAQSMSQTLLQWLQSSLGSDDVDTYAVPGPLKLADLMEFSSVSIPEINYPPAIVVNHPRLRELDDEDREKDIFQVIREGEFLVHHPFQSFKTSVLRFLETAADDPRTLAIKQTLYRTAKNSPIIQALVRAANNGKQVAVLVEIKARFDEANNIEWVKVLENAGVHVTYGLVGLKTHSKTILVVREDVDGLRSYCHIGTGNYHTGTARLYTDLGLFTCDPQIGQDLVHLFNFLTGHSRFSDYKRLLVAPVNMRARFLAMIDREIRTHTKRRPGRIIAKMNSLEDAAIIQELYRASQAGVEIDLIVRGFCCLRPGIKGVSENIRVTSVIGRFLEHSRVFYFYNGGKEEYYIGSADWMYRNLDGRVEAIVPVLKAKLQRQLKSILEAYLLDQRQTWDLLPDGSYVQRTAGRDMPGVQAELMGPVSAKAGKR
jgi:polyphosphate kinase